MYKGLFFLGLSLFYINVNAQADLDFYEVHELRITDFNVLNTSADVDFGYNLIEDKAKNIEKGYYLWIENSWYKVINDQKAFNVENKSPLYFSVNRLNKHDLKIKDQTGALYSYPIEAIEGYKISDLIYNTNIKVLNNIEKAKELKDSQPFNTALKVDDIAAVDLTITSLEEASDGTIILAEVLNESTNVTSISGSSEINKEIISLDTVKVKPKKETVIAMNVYEKAVADGFDGSLTEWVESINILGGKTAFQQAVDAGFKGTEEEWMRSLWGSELDPEIEKHDKVTGIVSQWISELKASAGNSPYDLALKNGFYGTYTEWIESVIGKDGEKEFNDDVETGFQGSYKEWIESKLTTSNNELLRKEKLKKNNFVVVPNLQLPLSEDLDEILQFNLYDYYNKYFGGSMLSSSTTSNNVKLLKTDLEYQITWYNLDEINILEISNLGVVKYQTVKPEVSKTSINVRYLMP